MRCGPKTLVLALLASLGLTAGALPGPVQPLSKSAELFIGVVEQHYADWDKNQDGTLSPEELNTVVADPTTTGSQAAAVAALKRAGRSKRYTLPPLSLDNIRQLAAQPPATNTANLPRMYLEGLRRITNAVQRDLFASGSPRLDTIHQGKLGNCFCLAPLGAMVHRDPHLVMGMFSRQEDGKYRVALGKHTVWVELPTDGEIAMTASNEGDGIWVNLYEKALGQARNESRPPNQRAGSPIDALARGGSAGTMLAFITGHEITRFSFKFAKDPGMSANEREAKLVELRRQLTAAAKERRLMTCGTIKTTTPGLNPNHAYAVLGYEQETDSVRLWNPHGGNFTPKGPTGLTSGYPAKDGIFSLPTSAFVQQFSGMAFETIEATKRAMRALHNDRYGFLPETVSPPGVAPCAQNLMIERRATKIRWPSACSSSTNSEGMPCWAFGKRYFVPLNSTLR